MHLWLSRWAASSAASCRGNSYRVSGAGMIVAMFRGFATLFLALLGSPEGPFIVMHCLLVWFGMLARGFLVTSDGSIYFGPESASLGLSVAEVLCLYAQDPVAQCLMRRCALHSWCLCFDLSCSRLGRVSDFVSLEFSTRFFNVSRFLVWLRASRTCTCDGFFPKSCLVFWTAAVSVRCFHSSRVVFFEERGRHPQMFCPQD